jgi:hypothetical protein
VVLVEVSQTIEDVERALESLAHFERYLYIHVIMSLGGGDGRDSVLCTVFLGSVR